MRIIAFCGLASQIVRHYGINKTKPFARGLSQSDKRFFLQKARRDREHGFLMVSCLQHDGSRFVTMNPPAAPTAGSEYASGSFSL